MHENWCSQLTCWLFNARRTSCATRLMKTNEIIVVDVNLSFEIIEKKIIVKMAFIGIIVMPSRFNQNSVLRLYLR